MPNHRLTISLPDEVSAALADLAEADGVSAGTYVRRMVMARVLGTDTRATPSTEPPWVGIAPTAAEWASLNLWLASNSIPDMPADWPRKRSCLLKWAMQYGFTL